MSTWQWRANADLTSIIFPSWTETLTKHLTREESFTTKRTAKSFTTITNYNWKITFATKSPQSFFSTFQNSGSCSCHHVNKTCLSQLAWPELASASKVPPTSTTILFFHCLFKDLTPSHFWLLENTNPLQKICLWSHKSCLQLLPEFTTAHCINYRTNLRIQAPTFPPTILRISLLFLWGSPINM